MIRVFELLRKINLTKVSGKDLYNKFLEEFKPNKFSCDICSAKHPDWNAHNSYDRYLICFEDGKSVTYLISIVIYTCSSCGHAHAVLPEFIIPYRSYCILFILSVMKDYFSKSLTVEKICDKYDIAVSTLYSWKTIFLNHKKLWLGILEDVFTNLLQFVNSFSDYYLHDFFLKAGISFLQSKSRTKKARSPPG